MGTLECLDARWRNLKDPMSRSHWMRSCCSWRNKDQKLLQNLHWKRVLQLIKFLAKGYVDTFIYIYCFLCTILFVVPFNIILPVIDGCGISEFNSCIWLVFIYYLKWHALDKSEQAKYYEMARKERAIHMQLYPGWSARDNYAQLGRKKKRPRDKSEGMYYIWVFFTHSTHVSGRYQNFLVGVPVCYILW